MLEKTSRVAGSFLSRNRRFLASASVTLGGSIVSRGVSMIAVIGAAGLLGAEGYGAYAFLLATVGLSSGVGQLGIAPVVSREIARRSPRDAAGFSSVVLATTAVVSGLTAAVSFVAIAILDVAGMSRHVGGWTGLGLVAWSAASGVSTISQAVLVGRQMFSSAALVVALRSLGVAGATVAGALSGDFMRTAVAVLAAECVFAAGTLGYLRRRRLLWFKLGVAGARAQLALVLRVGSSSGFASLMVQLSFWGGQAWLMSQEGGAAANGAFAVALRISLGASVVPAALTTVLVPMLSSGRSDISRRDSVALPTVIAALCASAAALAMPFLFDAWLVDYGGFAAVFYVMLVGIVPVVMNETTGAVALAGGHIRAWVVSDVVLAMSVSLIYWLSIPLAGAMGLAVAYVAGYAASMLVLLGVILRKRCAGDGLVSPLGIAVEEG